MDKNETCIIEQHNDSVMFLASMNRKYFFWMQVDNDPDWMIQ
jgi:hypothetical protein